MELLVHDLPETPAAWETMPERTILSPQKPIHRCVGCFGCWVKTPGCCVIPDAYQDVTGVTAAAADVLTGKAIVSAAGALVQGSMPNNGAISGTIDGISATSYSVPAGYTSGGSVSLTSDIEEALAAI